MELRQYGKVIMKRIWFIVSFVLIVSIIFGAFSFIMVKPVFEASNKLIVNKSSEFTGNAPLDVNSINTNIRLINTYKEIILTPTILDKVILAHPELKFTAEQLSKRLKVSSLNDTQVMTLSLRDASYERAAMTVNAVAEVFKAEIPSIMKVDNVTILNEAKLQVNPAPVNPDFVMYTTVGFLISLLAALLLAFLIEHLDDTVKSESDVEQYLGLPTLAVVMKAKKTDMKPSDTSSSHPKLTDAPKMATNHS